MLNKTKMLKLGRKLFLASAECNLTNNLFKASCVRYQTNLQQQLNNHSVTTKVNYIEHMKILHLENSGISYQYPSIWLRDNCQCSECFHKNSNSRVINWENFPIDATPVDVIVNEADEVLVTWSDGHKSPYKLNWLKDRSFRKDSQEDYINEFYRPKPRLWGKDKFNEVFKRFEFNDLMNSEEALHNWLDALTVNGIAIIKNTPPLHGESLKLINRVGFIKKTHYGDFFVVANKPDTTNVAYLSQNLQLHTDLPYYQYKPGTNLLHCIVQTNTPGGENLLTDGFYIADRLRREDPNAYRILSKTLVDWTDIGEENGIDFHTINRQPVIVEDYEGNVVRINHSTPQRGSHFTVPLEQVQPWYEASMKFVKLIYEESGRFKMEPGDILTFDNIRLLHGRTAYEDSETNQRYIVGAYVDWDIILAKLRILKKTLKKFK